MYLPIKIIKVVPKMSFPPGPPLHLPGMPPLPPMIPPPYSVPPMGGMIPMTVGMMPAPMMAPVAMTMPAPLPMPPPTKMAMKKMNTNHHNTTYKRENNYEAQEIIRGPPVTVFVGNITERAPDNLIRQILQRCGIVMNWKRVQGANGKLQAFGFCEYGEPEAALRAIRLLHEWEIGNKKLVVKVDAKTKEKLDEYKAKIMAKQDVDENKEGKDGEKEEGNENEEKEEGETSDDTLDEATRQRDEIIRSAIESIIRAHEPELSKPVEAVESPPPPIVHPPINQEKPPTKNLNSENSPKPRTDFERFKKNDLDEMDLEDDKRSLIHREIDKFRDTYKRAEEEKERDSGSSRDRRSSRRRDYESPETRFRDSRERDREKRYHRDRGSQGRDREDSGGRRRRRSRERSTRSPRESPVVTREPKERSRERQVERPRSPSRDREYVRERDTSERTKEKEWDKEEEEEAYERKKLERKLREKEAIYQERLRNWEARERRRAKEYDKEKVKTEEQKKDELKEARRLKEFLEDYDDERDDPKYFKGSSLLRRMKEREKEIEEDLLDRQREKEELDELRKKLAEEGHPDPEAEVERFLQEESRLVEPPLKDATPDSDQEMEAPSAAILSAKMKPIPKIPVSPPEPAEAIKHHKPLVPEDDNTQNSFSGFSDFVTQEETKPMGFTSLRIGGSPTQAAGSPAASQNASVKDTGSGSKRKMTIDEVFNSNDDEPEQKKKRKLIPLDDSQEDTTKVPGSISQMTIEEKRKHIKNLIDKIPTEKNELFAYTLDWSMVDKVLMEKRIRPWINKKIIEYIGEEEPTLVEFICSKIMAGSAAQSILDDVSMVLDDEAEVFVVKMWRLLIYEIEAKKLGLQENLSLGKS